MYVNVLTFTFGEDSMLSSAEVLIKFGPMRKCMWMSKTYKTDDVYAQKTDIKLMQKKL